jgi:prepilin-type N-terminal cleavage/methylation domain-containing protein
MFVYLKSKIRKDKSRGFTLIELVVSVSIIVTLTSMVLPSINNVRKQSRDTARAFTMRELQSSLDDYFDENGRSHQPIVIGSQPGNVNDCTPTYSADNWIPGLAPKYIRALPADPTGKPTKVSALCSSMDGEYVYMSPLGGASYLLLSYCAPESASAYNITNPMYDPTRATWAWKICGGVSSAACDAL